jgi:hypothetical protein
MLISNHFAPSYCHLVHQLLHTCMLHEQFCVVQSAAHGLQSMPSVVE